MRLVTPRLGVKITVRYLQCPIDILYKYFADLADYLTEGTENELQKVRACFTWLCSMDIGSLQHKVQKLPDTGTPLDSLLKIHWQMTNHSHVFAYDLQVTFLLTKNLF